MTARVVAAVALVTVTGLAQGGSATISGVVVLAGDSSSPPIRRAIVTLTGTGISTSLQAVTDDEGRFNFDGLPAGRFSLTSDKPAYLKSYYGSVRLSRPPGMPLALADGQRLGNIIVPMARGAAISGRVSDDFGNPLASAQVRAEMVTFVNGARRLISPPVGTYQVTTDDRGVYRLYGLPPGEYLVRASGGGGFSAGGTARVVTPAEFELALRPPAAGAVLTSSSAAPQFSRIPTYYPSASAMSAAQSVQLSSGDDRSDVNIASQLSRVVRVEGLAIGPDGQPAANISVGIANVSAGSLWASLGLVRADPQGRFFVNSLTPGAWMLFGRAAPPGTPSDGQYPWWGQTEFVVGDQDISGLVLTFAPGSTVSGRISFKGTIAPLDPTRLRVSLTPLTAIPETGAMLSPVTPAANGSFVVQAVPPGRYRVTLSGSGGWAVQSAVAGGRDVLDTPLEVTAGQDASVAITMTDQITEISGLLMDQLDRPAPEYSVIVFSANKNHWGTVPRRSSGIVKVASDGTYRISGLPAGAYVLCVVTDIEPGSLNDPAFLEELARAGVPISLAEGEKKRQNFKIGTGDPELGLNRVQAPRQIRRISFQNH